MHRLSAPMLSTVSIAAIAAIAFPSAALAQESTSQNDEGIAYQASEVELDGEAIVVVGSRLRRNQFNSIDPIQVITRDEATSAGFTSTAEILQSVGVTGGTPQINDTFIGLLTAGGGGANTLSLRGLGPTRTLVLLNGRRVAPAGSRGSVGSADLNVLPNSIIDRIEILTTGASSVYGSDAIAGVVNIVTRNRINGISLETQLSIPQDSGGFTQRHSLVAGTSGENFSISGSLEYYRRDRVTYGDRRWTSCSTAGYADGSDFIDPATGQPKCFPIDNGGLTYNTIGTDFIFEDDFEPAPGFETAPPGFFTFCNRFRPRAGATGALPGYECVGGVFFNPNNGQLLGTNLNVRDTSTPATLRNDLISPIEIYTAFLNATYETNILGNAQIYSELLFNRRKSNQNNQRQFIIDYAIDSPLLSPELAAAGPVNADIGLRVFADYGLTRTEQVQDFTKFTVGMRGDLFSRWRYDLFASRNWSDAEYGQEAILEDRLLNSLDVVANGDGTFSCRVTAGGCVAAPVLTPAVVGGNFDPAWFDYVVDTVVGRTRFTESVVNLTLDGPLFSLPAGDISAAVGFEYRRSEIDDTPSSDSVRDNLYFSASATPTRGKDAVWEVYGEIEVPILRDQPFARSLTLNLSGRYTEYESYGGDWTFKIGGLYAPTRWLSFRGSYGTSYRAPALFEQFLGASSGFLPSTFDPCDELVNVTQPLIRDRCLTEVPESFIQNGSLTVIGLGGAEAGLKAETSTNLTFGAVLQPNFGNAFGELSFAVDYFDIKIENGVAQLSAAAVLDQCYNNPERTTCGLITRAPYTGPGSGGLTVIQSYVNISDARYEGIDFVLRYARDLGPGRLRLGAQMTHLLSRYNRQLPTANITDIVGFIGTPAWSGTFDASYNVRNFTFRWGVDYIKGTSDNAFLEPFGLDPAVYNFTLPDYFLHNASIRYDRENWGLTLGLRNVFNTDPLRITGEAPGVNQVAGVPLQSGFDFRGRTFFLSGRVNF